MSSDPAKFDKYLADDGPAALVIREHLMPVEGEDGVFFPATFAAAKDKREFAGGYNIDTFDDGTNICLVDSVGSQANRIEPIFDARLHDGKYGKLVPQLTVRAGNKEISIFEAGHRAGDALVRCSELQQELHDAFQAVLNLDAMPLAKVAPTSLVFGVWDSRDTQAKLPRVVTSTIRAFNVRKLTRSAQFIPATEYVDNELLKAPDKKSEGSYAERGFIHVPATGTHGGVIADGDIRRDATLSLAAIRLLRATSPKETMDLQRYVLGLALTAFTFSSIGYLRAGCNLVLDPDKKRLLVEVQGDGTRKNSNLTHEDAYAYASAAAEAFGVAKARMVDFDKKLAAKDAAKDAKKK